jgi:hypothetical protein
MLEALHEHAQAIDGGYPAHLLPIGLQSPQHSFQLGCRSFDSDFSVRGVERRERLSRSPARPIAAKRYDQRSQTIHRALQQGNEPVQVGTAIAVDYALPTLSRFPDSGVEVPAGRYDIAWRRPCTRGIPMVGSPSGRVSGSVHLLHAKSQGLERLSETLRTRTDLNERFRARLVAKRSPVLAQPAELSLKTPKSGQQPVSMSRLVHHSRLPGEA